MQSGDKAYPDSFPIASGDPAGSIPHVLRLLDRPIAFHRCFVTLTGSVTAALMLSQAIYWQQRAKHNGGWWFKKQEEWTDETGLSRREQENARRKLRKLSLLHEERRGVPAQLWYRVDEIRLLEMLARPAMVAKLEPVSDCTKAPIQIAPKRQSGLAKTANLVGTNPPILLAQNRQSFKGTETTTETTTEITTTTPNPSSFNERAAGPETARGGGGQDPTPEDRGGDHGTAALESNGGNPVSGEETETAQASHESIDASPEAQRTVANEVATNERRPEFAYPAKLTDREREDIAAQVHALPAEVAQQMLDVIASKMQSAQIKTNPAAVLRGIARKYRADPAAFDPSSGFQIAEARHRRAEAEAQARARAEAERQASGEREALRAASEATEVRRRSIGSMLRALRGH